MNTNPTAHRGLYVKGRPFRVVKPGATIVGSNPDGPMCYKPCLHGIAVGEILVCAGIGRTVGDGTTIVKWADAAGNRICDDAEFQPAIGDMMGSVPDPDYLTPYDPEEDWLWGAPTISPP